MYETNVRAAVPVAAETDSWRQHKQIFDIYNLYRIVLGLILLISFYFRDISTTLGVVNDTLFVQTCIFYFVINAASLLPRMIKLSRLRERQLFVAVLIIDIVALVLLSYTCGGVSSGMAHLLIVPVATSSIIFDTRMSTFFAAIGSIGVIYSEAYLSFTYLAGENYSVQVGLLGFTLFATSFLLQYLGNRIRAKEIINTQQAASIDALREINEQIIQRMQTGILVVDQNGILLNYNNSAKRLLNFKGSEHSDPLLPSDLFTQMEIWKQNNSIRPKPMLLEENAPEIQANFTYLHSQDAANILIFLEDNSQLSSRAQHLKLMSLGRLTASIAHEVRNPLHAISHACQLLNESTTLPAQEKRLLEIILIHTQRVNSIIQNILELSRHRQAVPELLDSKTWLEEFLISFSNSYRETIDVSLKVDPVKTAIRFNPGQLEQLLTNLCDNGLRYSHKLTGEYKLAIEVSQLEHSQVPVLDVIDYGPGPAAGQEEQVFEPFYTTESSGTGLGLFICKEICEANQARIFFRRTHDNRSCFRIVFAHPDRNIT
jgi:two-component system, NtrC family, sensor histidine kinase PilS